jgi:NAD(P)-dependent dehydrogenase (short-subunit alcohol dehydrogenase family)
MAIVFTTGSTDGLGRAAAQSLPNDDHQVVLHTRSAERAAELGELASRAAGVVIGDLRSAGRIRSIADQVNAIGRMDAIIHNAVAYTEGSRGSTREGHAGVIAVNTLAPYMLTALIARPARLVYLSNTSSISATAASRETPAGGSLRAKARSRACGSARSCIQPCSSHSRMVPPPCSADMAQRGVRYLGLCLPGVRLRLSD